MRILALVIFIIYLSQSLVYCQSATKIPDQPKKKIALVIGNGSYRTSELANPENDARAISDVLKELGFTVQKYENLNQGQIKKAIDDFGEKLMSYEVGLFYFAGHGIQVKGYNYLIPVDAIIQSEQQVEYDCVRADRVLGVMEKAGTKINIIILDACRNNPFEKSWSRSASANGLAFMNAPTGTLIAYATSPGSVASDGGGRNGLYTSAILESIKLKNVTILQMFQNVRKIVNEKSLNQQTPWESTSLIGDFYFNVDLDTTKFNQPPSDKIILKSAVSGTEPIKVVIAGNQIWMRDNLNADKFYDGTKIPLVQDNLEWERLTTPAYCFYNNDTLNSNKFGALYNWYAVSSGKLCPTGWHIPTDSDWTILTDYLGGEGTAGGKLKEIGNEIWDKPNFGGIDEIGFSAVPGGYRYFDGNFFGIRKSGFWWSSSENFINSAWARALFYDNREIGNISFNKSNGYSIRCIKD